MVEFLEVQIVTLKILLDLFTVTRDSIKSNFVIVVDINFPEIHKESKATTCYENHILYKLFSVCRSTSYKICLFDSIMTSSEGIVSSVRYGGKLGPSDHINITFDIIFNIDIEVSTKPRIMKPSFTNRHLYQNIDSLEVKRIVGF
jgi:hypothetical protein